MIDDQVPRIAALFVGTSGRAPPLSDECVLLEIEEVDHGRCHCRAYDLTISQPLGVLTIGTMPFDQMVAFAQARFPGLTWRRLR